MKDKKYKLLKLYPTTPTDWEVGDVVEHWGSCLYHYQVEYKRGYASKPEVENYPEFWEEVVEKDYKILKFKDLTSGAIFSLNADGLYWYEESRRNGFTLENMLYKGRCVKNGEISIYSIERLCDGEIFTVGDDVKLQDQNKDRTIKSFELTDESIRFRFADGLGVQLKYYPRPGDIIHRSQTALFTTNDNLDIYHGEEYWRITGVGPYFISREMALETKTYNAEIPRFSTEEAARRWVENNRKQYSKADIKSALIKTGIAKYRRVDSFWEILDK